MNEEFKTNLIEEMDNLWAYAHKLESKIAELEAELRWIPVTERLPEDGVEKFVLVDGCANVGTHYAKGLRYLDERDEFEEEPTWEVGLDCEIYARRAYDAVTHWMSIPELPSDPRSPSDKEIDDIAYEKGKLRCKCVINSDKKKS